MKKVISMILALAMIASLSVTALAADNVNTVGGSASTQVTASYVGGTEGGTVFSVDIEWANMSFTYNEGSEAVWDPQTHSYLGEDSEAGWVESNAYITITNHSNTFITATPSYAKAAGYTTASVSFSTNKKHIGSADNGLGANGAGQAVSGTITVTPTGTLPEGTSNATIGTITVTITEFADVTTSAAESLYMSVVTMLNSLEGNIVDSEAEAESGEKYILKADWDDWYAKTVALSNAVFNYNKGGGTEELQAALNQAYIDLEEANAAYYPLKTKA